jgi:hypothetical protein
LLLSLLTPFHFSSLLGLPLMSHMAVRLACSLLGLSLLPFLECKIARCYDVPNSSLSLVQFLMYSPVVVSHRRYLLLPEPAMK